MDNGISHIGWRYGMQNHLKPLRFDLGDLYRIILQKNGA